MQEHPGVNLGVYMKKESRLPSTLRRQILAGLRYSSGLEGCPPGDMYINSHDKINNYIESNSNNFDIFVTQGAGSVSNVCESIREKWAI